MTQRVKTITVKPCVLSWVVLTLEVTQTKTLKEARLLSAVVEVFDAKAKELEVKKVRRAKESELEDAQVALEKNQATDVQKELLRLNRFEWVKEVYAHIDSRCGFATTVVVDEEAVNFALDVLSKQSFDGLGRMLLLQFADAVETAPASAVKKE